jgi:hypothetical protein
MTKNRKWTNEDVNRDAQKFERAKRRTLGTEAPSKGSPGERFAREILDPAKLPMKPPGAKCK